MSFWDSIKRIFQRTEGPRIEEELREDPLEYTGLEPDCWACELSIHKTHRRNRLNGKMLHRKCFRKLKRIAAKGGRVDEFLN